MARKSKPADRATPAVSAAKPTSAARDSGWIEEIRDLAEPLCESEGYELVHLEFQAEPGGRTLRLYIDQPGGISLDDCAAVSRQLSDLLDVALDDIGAYNLEVSSPGPERPLGKLEDFSRFQGCRAKIRTARPVEGQKNFTGILSGVDKGVVNLATVAKTVAIPYDLIQRARLADRGDFGCRSQT